LAAPIHSSISSLEARVYRSGRRAWSRNMGVFPFGKPRFVAGGDSLVAHRGVVGPGTDMWPECQAGLRLV
jgi:hypothetical protein